MRRLILGTAGHVDHGKTALVRALTGVDTDRLKEEKERGITIELGFAELAIPERDLRFGVVDVPGHEDFVRMMVAGAAGMDVVLLVVAADEGVMPQTREHLAIVELLDVPQLVVALTKADLVDAEWLGLVEGEVADLLARTRYAGSVCVATSSTRAQGIEALVAALAQAAERVGEPTADWVRLPLDRVFTVQGTGTVVTGTLWSGSLRVGDQVRILPGALDARVRRLQVHGREVDEVRAGDRTAVALSGDGADRDRVQRGSTLVASGEWIPSETITARVRILQDAEWSLAPRQRVRVHHGTAEVLARCSLLDADQLDPGRSGWVQLHLEEPLAVRARDPIVIRAYSPVTTIGGGVVAEVAPPKRKKVDERTVEWLRRLLEGESAEAVGAVLELGGLEGVRRAALPVHTGLTPDAVERGLAEVDAARSAGREAQRVYGATALTETEALVERAVDDAHASDPLREAVPLTVVRQSLPREASPELLDAAIERLAARGALELLAGGVRRSGHRASPTAEQEAATEQLLGELRAGGLGAPSVDELPEELRARPDLWSLLRRLESLGTLRQVADGLFLDAAALDAAAGRIHEVLGGQKDLGPTAFKDVLPVTRKRLLPLLAYFDGRGVTLRRGEGRDVP